MGRLPEGDRERRKGLLFRLLRRHRNGLREQEIASETGWQRRTVNNYLRQLQDEEKAYREGRDWFAD